MLAQIGRLGCRGVNVFANVLVWVARRTAPLLNYEIGKHQTIKKWNQGKLLSEDSVFLMRLAEKAAFNVILVFSKSLKQHKGGLFQTRGAENETFFFGN